MSLSAPFIWLDDQLAGTQRVYKDLVEIITVYSADKIKAALEKLEAHRGRGHYIAGYAAYELGYILEPKLRDKLPDDFDAPLLQFGVFTSYETPSKSMGSISDMAEFFLTPAWSEADYLARYDKVKDYIRAGDIYQINLCFPLHGTYEGTAAQLYAGLRARQPVHYGGVVSLGDGPDIISLSPELFFKRQSDQMTMRPMKGTIKRLADKSADVALRDSLKSDAKSQAENLMIVDLLRNDLSRISRPGSVKVPELYSLETYPTLHQMTSKVTSTLNDNTSFTDIFKALFPCGSVTGAPKIRAMEIIRELEDAPRGAYCGALGYIDPETSDGQSESCFNVGIRTLILEDNKLRYNVGSGVVLDSDGVEEYRECLLKADVVRPKKDASPPHLVETMRLTSRGDITRLNLHLARLSRSAQALRYPFYRNNIYAELHKLVALNYDQKLRLSLFKSGKVRCELSKINELTQPLKLAISKNPLTPEVQETRYKVSDRSFYDGERARLKALCGADEVLFLNAEGELCEGSFTSLFVKTAESFLTPDIRCGLLPGVLRADMLVSGQVKASILTLADLDSADIFMGNSLRGMMAATLISLTPQ